MVQQHRHCISVPEHLKGFQQELILMNELDAMISMDSSNMHLASLVATPVVSVWEQRIVLQALWAGIKSQSMQ